MSAMTPERLQQIKERYADEMIRREHVAELIDTVDHLAAENARLRAGIEALHRPVEIEPSDTICGHCSWRLPNGRFFGQVVEWPCETADLLDPPTEGELK